MLVPRLPAASEFADHIARLLFKSLVTVLGLACAAGIWRVAAILRLHVPLDPNEGWNAYHTAAAMAGHGLYPAATSFTTNNYPPLSFYLVGIVGMVTGDTIVAGRIVCLLSFLTVAGEIALIARRFGCGRLEATFAALLFGGFLLLNSDYVGMDDPQLLGHALQISALLLLLSGSGSLTRIAGSAALFVAALFVKHNLVALPLAGVIWLLVYDRRTALRLAAFMLALGFAGLAASRLVFGVDLLSRLNAARSYSPSLLFENFRDWLIPAAIPLTATLAAGSSRDAIDGLVSRDRQVFVDFYDLVDDPLQRVNRFDHCREPGRCAVGCESPCATCAGGRADGPLDAWTCDRFRSELA